MHKIILIFLYLFLFSQISSAQEKTKIDKFLDEVNSGFVVDSKKLTDEYKLGKYDRWDADQDTGKLVFSHEGKPKVIASFQIAGSYSNTSKTWKWSWSNDTVDLSMKRDMNKVKEFGEKIQSLQLTTAQFDCDEDYAWKLVSMAGQIIKAKGAYRGKIPNGFVYLLITEIKWADAK